MPDASPRPVARALRAGKAAAQRVGERVVAQRLAELEHGVLGHVDEVAREAARRLDDHDGTLAGLNTRVQDLEPRLTAVADRLGRLEEVLEELGAAISRESGLPGAAGSYREALYLLHELRRDLRRHEAGHGNDGQIHGGSLAISAGERRPGDGSAVATCALDPYAGKHPRRFDYAGFERRFRGDPEDVRSLLLERYGDLVTPLGPVVDIGCGRGELLGALLERGVEVVGVEPEPALAAEARERGVPVEEMLGADFLRGVEDGSLGAVVCFHVVEHLIVDDLIELLELAARKLRPGGVFVAETPNPMTFLTLHESYLLDPTHVQPLHPALLTWLAETAGFRGVEVTYHSPAASLALPKPDPDDDTPLAARVRQAFERLDHQLFGPQDYSVVARV